MAPQTISDTIRVYLAALHEHGIHASRGILYGSFATDSAEPWSDIDLVVLAPEFDGSYTDEQVRKLWRATLAADNRIEPVPCGEQEWKRDDSRHILEVARREGIEIRA